MVIVHDVKRIESAPYVKRILLRGIFFVMFHAIINFVKNAYKKYGKKIVKLFSIKFLIINKLNVLDMLALMN